MPSLAHSLMHHQLSQHEIDVCSEYVHAFMGPAFRGIFLKIFEWYKILGTYLDIFYYLFLSGLDAAYVGNAQAICHYWYDGVCHEPRNSKMFPMK